MELMISSSKLFKSVYCKLRPADIVMLIFLCIVNFTIALNINKNPGLVYQLYFHSAFLAGYIALLVLSLTTSFKILSAARVLATVAVIASFYKSLGLLGFVLMPYQLDKTLSNIDTLLFGGINPTFLAQKFITPWGVEFFSFIYILFLVYVYVSVILSSFGKNPTDREEFLLGLSLVYTIGYLGYIFLPAQGPMAFHVNDYTTPLSGYAVYKFMDNSVKSFGGAIGAFPSLHVGGAVFLCLFDLKRNRFRGLTYIPAAVLIILSTLYLRFHYISDWIGGIAVTLFSLWAAPKITAAWETKRNRQTVVENGRD